jgi:hypothetical protein
MPKSLEEIAIEIFARERLAKAVEEVGGVKALKDKLDLAEAHRMERALREKERAEHAPSEVLEGDDVVAIVKLECPGDGSFQCALMPTHAVYDAYELVGIACFQHAVAIRERHRKAMKGGDE